MRMLRQCPHRGPRRHRAARGSRCGFPVLRGLSFGASALQPAVGRACWNGGQTHRDEARRSDEGRPEVVGQDPDPQFRPRSRPRRRVRRTRSRVLRRSSRSSVHSHHHAPSIVRLTAADRFSVSLFQGDVTVGQRDGASGRDVASSAPQTMKGKLASSASSAGPSAASAEMLSASVKRGTSPGTSARGVDHLPLTVSANSGPAARSDRRPLALAPPLCSKDLPVGSADRAADG